MDAKDIRNIQEAYLDVYSSTREIDELYKGKHGQSETEYMSGRSDAGKRISGDEKEGPASYASRWHKGSKPTRPGQKPKNVQKLSQSEKDEIAYRKARLKKEEVDTCDSLDEAEKWIQKAIKKPGALSKQLGVPEDENIPAEKLSAAAKKGGKLGKRARLAMTLKGLRREEIDLYDIIFTHLIEEGYADTEDAAHKIMVNMSEEWRESIVESVRPGNVETPLDKAAFKKRRRSLAGKEASAEARKRGHEGKTWADSGRTYSPDEAKSRRKNMSDTHRSLSYGTAENPDDNEGYPAVKTKNPKKLRKQKAMGELG